MEGELVAAVVGAVFFLTLGGVVLMRPIATRLSQFLEVLIEERRGGRGADSDARTRRLVDSLEARLDSLEHRVHFTEELLGSQDAHPSLRESSGSGAGDGTDASDPRAY